MYIFLVKCTYIVEEDVSGGGWGWSHAHLFESSVCVCVCVCVCARMHVLCVQVGFMLQLDAMHSFPVCSPEGWRIR